MRRCGFTLLEVLVATVLMAIAITGVLAGLRTSLSNAARITDYERAVALARRQMEELLVRRDVPRGMPFEGRFGPEMTGGIEAGWRARVIPFEAPGGMGQAPPVGARVLERIELEIWWMRGRDRRTFQVDAYRGVKVTPENTQHYQSVGQPSAGEARGQ